MRTSPSILKKAHISSLAFPTITIALLVSGCGGSSGSSSGTTPPSNGQNITVYIVGAASAPEEWQLASSSSTPLLTALPVPSGAVRQVLWQLE